MGSVKKVFGGGSKSSNKVSSSNQTVIKNNTSIDVANDLHFEELGESLEKISENELSLTSEWYEYLKSVNTEKTLSQEEENEQEKALKLLALKQNAESLEQSKLNTKYTVILAVIGIALTVWQINKKGKRWYKPINSIKTTATKS